MLLTLLNEGCNPAPAVVFTDKTFCFTGEFVFGERKLCTESTIAAGGLVMKNPTKKLNFLVIGQYVSDAWKHSTFGNKIEKAMHLRDSTPDMHIISEALWTEALKANK
jgi:NAD-dependent DNA ligase